MRKLELVDVHMSLFPLALPSKIAFLTLQRANFPHLCINVILPYSDSAFSPSDLYPFPEGLTALARK